MEIKITEHSNIPNQKVIEILEGDNLIAAIVPKMTTISIISEYIKDVVENTDFPPAIIINLKERIN